MTRQHWLRWTFAVMGIGGGCGEATQSTDVYEEVLDGGLAAARSEAYRLTLFEYDGRVGGFIEFFAIDGERNTRINPYFAPTDCAYFGDGAVTNDTFPIIVDRAGGTFMMVIDRAGSGVVGTTGGAEITFARRGRARQRSCPDAAARLAR